MKLRLSLALPLLIALAACGGPQPATPTSAPAANPTTAPEVIPTSVPPAQLPPTTISPTNTSPSAPASPAPTETLPAPTDTIAPRLTDTGTAKPRPNQTSASPLSAAIYPANCRSEPTTDKPGRVILQISIEANGGNGRYRYFYQGKESPTKFIEVIGEKGTRLIGEVDVTSGDGQEIKKEFDMAISQLTCP